MLKTKIDKSRFLLVAVIVATALFAASPVTQAASEWKWSKDKGWSESSGTARGTAGQQLRYAYSLEKKGEYYDAAKQYFLLLKVYPNSKEAGIGLQRLAGCLIQMEEFYTSFKALEQVFESYPDSARVADLVEIEYSIGEKLKSGKYGRILADGDKADSSRRMAVEVFEAVLKHDPYGAFADKCLLALGDTYLELKNPEKAKTSYQRLITEFNRSKFVDRARLGLTRAKVLLKEASRSEVQQVIEEHNKKAYLNRKMDGEEENVDESVNELEELQAKEMWEQIQFYLRRGDHKSTKAAKFLCRQIVHRYGRSSYAVRAQRLLPKIIVPKEGKIFKIGKFDFNPFSDKKEDKFFVTPKRGVENVDTVEVMAPVSVPGAPAFNGRQSITVKPRAMKGATVPAPPVDETTDERLPRLRQPEKRELAPLNLVEEKADKRLELSPPPVLQENNSSPRANAQGVNPRSSGGWDVDVEGTQDDSSSAPPPLSPVSSRPVQEKSPDPVTVPARSKPVQPVKSQKKNTGSGGWTISEDLQ